jgi:hypothetical protein
MSKARGRPRFLATEEQRTQVELLSRYGVAHDDICSVIVNPQTGAPIDTKTLRLNFRAELDRGQVQANAKVAESLFRKATGDGQGSVIAAIFWLKTRAGWRETAVDRPGKKEVANADAVTAGHGTTWGDDLDFERSRAN